MLDSRGSDGSFQPGGIYNFNDGNFGTRGGNMCYDSSTDTSCLNVDLEQPRLVLSVVVIWAMSWYDNPYKNQDFTVTSAITENGLRIM